MNKATSFVLIILTIGLLVSVACSPKVEPGNPLLPPGFEEALLPDVDINGYVYLRRGEPFHLSTSYFKRGTQALQSIDTSQLSLGMDSTAIFAGSSVDTFGGIVDFSSGGDAAIVQELLKRNPYIWSRRSTRSIALVAGQDAWALSLKSVLRVTVKRHWSKDTQKSQRSLSCSQKIRHHSLLRLAFYGLAVCR